jgi:hypothetical protein
MQLGLQVASWSSLGLTLFVSSMIINYPIPTRTGYTVNAISVATRVERPVIVHLRYHFLLVLQEEGPIVYGVQRVDRALLFAHLLH